MYSENCKLIGIDVNKVLCCGSRDETRPRIVVVAEMMSSTFEFKLKEDEDRVRSYRKVGIVYIPIY